MIPPHWAKVVAHGDLGQGRQRTPVEHRPGGIGGGVHHQHRDEDRLLGPDGDQDLALRIHPDPLKAAMRAVGFRSVIIYLQIS